VVERVREKAEGRMDVEVEGRREVTVGGKVHGGMVG